MQNFLGIFSSIGDSIESFTSIDCLINGLHELNIDDGYIYYIKTIMISSTPIILIVIFAMILIILNISKK